MKHKGEQEQYQRLAPKPPEGGQPVDRDKPVAHSQHRRVHQQLDPELYEQADKHIANAALVFSIAIPGQVLRPHRLPELLQEDEHDDEHLGKLIYPELAIVQVHSVLHVACHSSEATQGLPVYARPPKSISRANQMRKAHGHARHELDGTHGKASGK